MNIDTGPEISAAVGGAVVILAGIYKAFSGNDGKHKGEEVLANLLKNQADQTLIMSKLTLIIEFALEQTKEFHAQNKHAVNELDKNQREIIGLIRNIDNRLRAGWPE